jgi:regulator of sigma E protease
VTTILAFALVISVLVVVHELGHHLMAKWFGVPVEIFSVGFGPRLLAVRYRGTEYRLSAIPFGGYVKMAGTSLSGRDATPDGFDSKPSSQRFLILLAGPAMNVGFALLLATVGLWCGIELPAGKHPVMTTITAGGTADRAELQIGDVITAVDGTATMARTDVAAAVAAASNHPVALTVERAGEMLTVTLPAGSAFDAVAAVPRALYRPEPVDAPILAVRAVVSSSVEILTTIGGLVTGAVSPRHLIGPVGLAQMAGESSQLGWRALLAAMAFISLNLGLCNLLPIPILDGGHMLMLFVEGITRRDVPFRFRKVLVGAGAMAMLLLLVTTFYNDLGRLGWLAL